MENRLFIASYEDIAGWGSRPSSLLNTLEKTDQIFLIANQELNKAKSGMIDNMKKKAHVRIMDLDNQNSGLLGMMLLIEFLKKEEKKYVVYIIGASLNCIYEDSDEIRKYAINVVYHHNFQVKRLSEKEEERREEEETSQLFLEAVMGYDGILGSSESSNCDNFKESGKEQSEHKKKKDSGIKQVKRSEKKMTNNSKSTSRAIRPNNVSLTKKNSSVEQEIFGTTIESKEYQESFTDLQDARAHFIANLQDRTESHIRQKLFSKESTITLTQEQFYDFVALMMSSDNAAMFINSWSSQHNLNVDMNDDTFSSMYPEIKFFNDVCELLYDRDFWED